MNSTPHRCGGLASERRISQILQHGLKQRQPPTFAIDFLGWLDAAQLD